MATACSRESWLLLCGALCACVPSGEVAQPYVEIIELTNADLRDMVFDRRGADPVCLYIADNANNQVHCLHLATRALDKSKAIDLVKPIALALSRDENELYIGAAAQTNGGLYEADPTRPGTVSPVAIDPGVTDSIYDVGVIAPLSNGHVAVNLRATDSAWQKIVYTPPLPAAPSSLSKLPTDGHRIVGASDDGELFATAEDAPNTSGNTNGWLVTLWRTAAGSAEEISSDNYLGHAVQRFASLVFHPLRHEFFVLTDGTTSGRGAVPVYRVTDSGVEPLSLQLAANYPAVALAFTSDARRILLAHGTTPFNAFEPNHDLAVPDLHVFDALTGAEVGVIPLPAHVRDRGIAVAPDGTIYVLLGEGRSSQIGVIRNPG